MANGDTEIALESGTEKALRLLKAREAGLVAQLSAISIVVQQAEANAHGVLRCDPPTSSEDTSDGVMAVLRARAHARVGEWAAALGGGRVTLSQAFPLPASSAATNACDCRREAHAVQLYAQERRLQVAAIRLSGLPPDGRRCQIVDVTWLDAVGGSDGVHHGLPRLAALAGAVHAPIETYNLDTLCTTLCRLEVPPLDYVHLRTQPLLHGGMGECLGLSRVLAAVGAELVAWARLDEPLPPNDGAADALHFGMLNPPAYEGHGGGSSADVDAALSAPAARADLAVRWWQRLHLYLGSAMLGHAELGMRRWLDSANSSMRAYRGSIIDESEQRKGGLKDAAAAADLLLDAPNAVVLALRIQHHPRANDERKVRAARLIEALISSAPAPVGPAVAQLAARHAQASAAAAAEMVAPAALSEVEPLS